MRILLIGAKGQLGSDIARVLSSDYELIALDVEDIDISIAGSVEKAFEKYRPHIAINTAAFTNIPECENDDVKAFMINGLGPKFIAQNCLRHDCTLFHMSTDYVFDGNKIAPYTEDDVPNPLNAYGVSKLAGECYIKALMEKYIIIRTCGLYGVHRCVGKGTNFVDTMLKLAKENKPIRVIADEILTPTYTLDLANQVKELLGVKAYGIFHATSEGSCSWYEFAKTIFDFCGIKADLVKIQQKGYDSSVKRPLYSVLENKKLKILGLNKMRNWKEALKDYLKEKNEFKDFS